MNRIILLISVLLVACTCKPESRHEIPQQQPAPRPELEVYENSKISVLWGDTNVRYPKYEQPKTPCNCFEYTAWRGEKVSAEALIWAKTDLSGVTLSASNLVSNTDGVIPGSAVSFNFLGYVIGDVLNPAWYCDCGARPIGSWATIHVADRLDHDTSTNVVINTTQPVWMSIKVPHDIPAGVYTGEVTVNAADMDPVMLPVWLNIADYDLPDPHDWKFHLDLWQNPELDAGFAASLTWQDKHFEHMRPLMKMLADAGQKVITAKISQSAQIKRTKNADGTWKYDYTVFDKWVNFMMELGIDSQIDCYGMIPWSMRFDYYDAAQKKTVYVSAEAGEQAYNDFWQPFIKDFASHLKEKGWFDKTYLAFDERSQDAILKVMRMVMKTESGFRFSHTGTYFKSVAEKSAICCITFENDYPQGIVEQRRAQGYKSTYYTCCAQRYPNTMMDSPLEEGVWYAWAARAKNLDGYLRWSYNIWDNADPVNDVRHEGGPSGDRYIVYPDARSSVRFEKVIEGIQDYEKTRILKEKWEQEGNSEKLDALQNALSRFTFDEIPLNGPGPALKQAKLVLE